VLVYGSYGRTSNTEARISGPIAGACRRFGSTGTAILAETRQDGMTTRIETGMEACREFDVE
jgi:hypothetical protein